MDLWSKGLGRRVLSLTLGERDLLAENSGYLVIEGVMHAPTYWDFQVSLEEDDITEFLELLLKPDSLRYLATSPDRTRILRTATSSAAVFLWRTLRLALGGSGGTTEPAREITLRRAGKPEPDESWDDAVVDWDAEGENADAGT